MRGTEIRPARPGDGDALAALLSAYLAERHPAHSGTTAGALEREVLSGASGLRVLVSIVRARPSGFVAWHRVYDLHWGKAGAQVADLYVAPGRRGLGDALALLAAACDAARSEGGTYLQGGSFDPASAVGRFYDRVAVISDSAECHCAGRAFRRLADLHEQPRRTLIRALPLKAWNFEP